MITTILSQKHSNCRCCLIRSESSNLVRGSLDELGLKLAASLLLTDRLSGIVVPSQEEWIGVNLLERDDGLPKLAPNIKCSGHQ